MQWDQYVALLSWQGLSVLKEDIERVQSNQSCIHRPEDILKFVQSEKLKCYILQNKKWWKTCESHIISCKEKGVKLVWHGHADWPQQLSFIPLSPPLLSYRGSPSSWNNNFQLCVVGSRKSHSISLDWMDFYLNSFLKKQVISVLSGGARGIDQKAHSLALRLKKPTICFLPCGLDTMYPSSLQTWVQPILDQGGSFISPFPPYFQIRKSFFHYRNSLMVKMSHMVFIVQAEERSGSMLTAQLAARLGKTICTLPGPVMNSSFKGNLNLIYDGAPMVKDEKDLEVLFYIEKNLNPTSESVYNSDTQKHLSR